MKDKKPEEYKWRLEYECLFCGHKWKQYQDELVDYNGDYCEVCDKYSPNSIAAVIEQGGDHEG